MTPAQNLVHFALVFPPAPKPAAANRPVVVGQGPLPGNIAVETEAIFEFSPA